MSFHCIVWYCMVLYCIRFFCTVSHCHVPLLQRAGELPRSASSHFDILPKKIVLFPIPILILFPVTSPAPFYRFPVSLQDLQKPHWKPITPCHIKGGQKHRTKNIRQKTLDKNIDSNYNMSYQKRTKNIEQCFPQDLFI